LELRRPREGKDDLDSVGNADLGDLGRYLVALFSSATVPAGGSLRRHERRSGGRRL